MTVVITLAAVAVVGTAALAGRRFVVLRSRGTSVALRRLPAAGAHGWRHGLIRYDGELLHYYKLRSLAPGPDTTFHRLELSLVKRRDLTPSEAAFIPAGSRVLVFHSGWADWEIAVDPHVEMGFTAWLESAPDIRQERPDYRRLRERVSQARRRRDRGRG